MSLRNRLFLPVILAALAALAGCGGSSSSSTTVTPPPSGGFSNSNFSGTYTFAVSGANANGIFVMGGGFVGCGCSQGNITSGTIDIDDPTGAQPGLSLLTNSSYHITPDGRGLAKLIFNTATISGYEIDLDFVLTSSSHGLVIRYDGNGTASGTIDLQSSVSQSQLATVFYAYTLSGSDLSNRSLASIGEFSLDGTGVMTSGIADFNYSTTPSSQLALSGSLTVGSGTTPGTASLQTTFSSAPLTFDVFAIDSTHLKLIESDGQSILAGDVLLSPSAAFPSGNLAFSMAGLDSVNNLFVAGGVMASDGASAISSGFEDVNDNGIVDNSTNPATPFSFSGSFTEVPSSSGRFVVTLTGFAGGTQFIAYPSSGGLLMLEQDTGLGAGVTGGIALEQQSGVTDLASQGYGLNLTGADLSVLPATEVDEIAEFKANAGSLTGVIDVNDGGSLSTSNLTGSYSGSNGSGSATLNFGVGSIFYYVVDNSTALFISSDPTESTFGSMEVQTTPSNSASLGAQSPHVLPMFRVIPHTLSAAQRAKGGITKK